MFCVGFRWCLVAALLRVWCVNSVASACSVGFGGLVAFCLYVCLYAYCLLVVCCIRLILVYFVCLLFALVLCLVG